MTSTIAEIVARPHRDVGYVLFIEGLPFAFTDRSELAGSGVGSWISGAPGGDRVVIEGLTVPETISYATSLEDGMLSSEDGASFQLTDFEGKLVALDRQRVPLTPPRFRLPQAPGLPSQPR